MTHILQYSGAAAAVLALLAIPSVDAQRETLRIDGTGAIGEWHPGGAVTLNLTEVRGREQMGDGIAAGTACDPPFPSRVAIALIASNGSFLVNVPAICVNNSRPVPWDAIDLQLRIELGGRSLAPVVRNITVLNNGQSSTFVVSPTGPLPGVPENHPFGTPEWNAAATVANGTGVYEVSVPEARGRNWTLNIGVRALTYAVWLHDPTTPEGWSNLSSASSPSERGAICDCERNLGSPMVTLIVLAVSIGALLRLPRSRQ